MKSLLSFRLGWLVALTALLAPAVASAQSNTVTLNFTAGFLYNSTGVTLNPDNLVLLIADTGNDGFGPLAAGSNLSLGSLLNGNDQIVGVTAIQAQPGTAIASFTVGLQSGQFPNLNTGERLALVWFSDLTSSSTVLTAGATYGLFTGTSVDSDGSWLVPATSGTADFNFTTQASDPGGTHAETEGYASLTAVPEPATFSLIAGAAACLAGLAQARHSRKRDPRPSRTFR